jgi:predicted DNA-binding transcriptional regulator AlpA
MISNPQKPCRTNLSRSLNTAQAAELLGIRPATLRGWKAQRLGPPFIQLSPRCVRYDERDIQLYVDERRVVPSVRETESRHAAL